jgi:predicted ArsR family transcriptional regulator
MAGQKEREWTEAGEYAEMYSLEEVLDLVRQAPHQVATTTDITEALGCTRATARRKLQELAMEGKLERRKPSGKITLWYTPEEDAETTLKRLSNELGEAITVGDTVYEDGDEHPVDAET